MVGANRLILFDPDWNPAVDKQAAGTHTCDVRPRGIIIGAHPSVPTPPCSARVARRSEEEVFHLPLPGCGLNRGEDFPAAAFQGRHVLHRRRIQGILHTSNPPLPAPRYSRYVGVTSCSSPCRNPCRNPCCSPLKHNNNLTTNPGRRRVGLHLGGPARHLLPARRLRLHHARGGEERMMTITQQLTPLPCTTRARICPANIYVHEADAPTASPPRSRRPATAASTSTRTGRARHPRRGCSCCCCCCCCCCCWCCWCCWCCCCCCCCCCSY